MPRARILFVDDQFEICEVVSDGLESEGFSVTCAPNANVARDHLVASKFDLAVLDISMPGEHGISLAHHVANLGVPVILTSGQPGNVERLDEGVYPVVPKPFRIRELAAAIHDQLRAKAPAPIGALRRRGL